MNEIWGHVVGVIILLLMATFIGIWIWAWQKRHRKVFDRMARLPMEDKEGHNTSHEVPPTDPEDRQ